jgi:hypothetical protein
VTILMLFCITIIMAMIVFTVDLARLYVVKNQMQNANDAGSIAAVLTLASLAGDADDDEREVSNDVIADMKSNCDKFLLLNRVGFGGKLTTDDIDVRVGIWSSADGFFETTVNANAVTVISRQRDEPVMFARFFGHDSFDVAAESIAVLSNGRSFLVPK